MQMESCKCLSKKELSVNTSELFNIEMMINQISHGYQFREYFNKQKLVARGDGIRK